MAPVGSNFRQKSSSCDGGHRRSRAHMNFTRGDQRHRMHWRFAEPPSISMTQKTTERDMTGNFPDPATHRLLSPPANPRPRLHKSKPVTIREKCRQQSITLQNRIAGKSGLLSQILTQERHCEIDFAAFHLTNHISIQQPLAISRRILRALAH